jgi:hygromycin-B 7''-O-kinase
MPIADSFETLLTQPARCLGLARAVCRANQLPCDCTRVIGGSRLVFATSNQRILKIFPPEDGAFYQTERLFLAQLAGRLPIATPRLDAWGEVQGYPYLVMEQLPGVSLDQVWETLSDQARACLMYSLGQAVRALHNQPVRHFQAAPFIWDELMAQQQTHLLEHHRAFGLAQPWVEQVEVYMRLHPLAFADPSQQVPLHTEVMREHVFVRQEGPAWALAGLIDFEPSMLGQREYEFAAVGVFITRGRRELLRQFLLGYGYTEAELTPLLSRKIMQLLLLHRYCNLNWFLTLTPPGLTRLEELEQFWFGL